MVAWISTRWTHYPRLSSITDPRGDFAALTSWRGKALVASAARVAVGLARAVWVLAADAGPARVALALGERDVAVAVARAWAAPPHSVGVVLLVRCVARAAGNLTEVAPRTASPVADAELLAGVVLAHVCLAWRAAALRIAALTVVAGLALAVA
jgi:hypothetical protein